MRAAGEPRSWLLGLNRGSAVEAPLPRLLGRWSRRVLRTDCKQAALGKSVQGFLPSPVTPREGWHNQVWALGQVRTGMDYRILGSFEVRTEGRLVGLGGEKPRALLAILLLHRNEVVSADRLIDDLWGESPPETALRTLRAYVSRLRKALGANGAPPDESDRASGADGGVLVTQGHGYVLRVAPGELDVERFGEMADRGREALAARKPGEAAAMLSEALGIWRGPPLTDFAYEPFAQSSIAQLEELQLAAIEDRVEADLALGRARNLVGELRDLVARQPLRERLRGQLMLALYRSGRQAEALEVFQEFRRTLSEELGLEPGPAIQQLELSILSRDPALDLAAGDAASEAGGELWTAAAPGRVVAIGRRRLTLAVGAAGLLILVLAAVVMGPCGWPTATRERCHGSTRARGPSLRRSRWAHRRAGSRSHPAPCGSPITTATQSRGSIRRSIGSCRRSRWATRRLEWLWLMGRCGWSTQATALSPGSTRSRAPWSRRSRSVLGRRTWPSVPAWCG